MNFFWQCVVELPAYMLGRVLGDRLGRRLTTVLATFFIFITAGIQMIIVVEVSNEIYELILAMCIKFFVCVSFCTIILQGMEVYPTCVRQTGTSFVLIIGTLCTTTGPYIISMGTNKDARIPYAIMAVISLIACFGGLFLPETLNQKLPETLEDAQEFGKGQVTKKTSFFSIKIFNGN